jgi:peptide/nickel transport system permease protein
VHRSRGGIIGALARFAESRTAVAAVAVLAAIAFIALVAPWIASQNPYAPAALNFMDGRLPPGSRGAGGTFYPLGTDNQGRDILSAIFYGLRTSLIVSVISGVCSLALGTTLGVLAGYRGGAVDALIMRAVDVQLSVPAMLVALVLIAVLGRGEDKVIIALIWAQWMYFARTARGSALVQRNREYVEAARSYGASSTRIIFMHVLPNCAGPLTVVATVVLANAISLEATLSFLGVGLPVARPSLGLLVANGFPFLLDGEYWMSVFPGAALVVLVFALNVIGDRIRDVLDPRAATRWAGAERV